MITNQAGQGIMLTFDQPITAEDVLNVFVGKPGIWKTRKNVASALGRAKSPSLIKLLNQMVIDGQLEQSLWRLPNGVDMIIYKDPNASA